LPSLVNRPLHVRIARNLVWSVVGEGGTRLVSFVTLLYLARALGPARFGAFALIQAATTYVWVLSEFAGSSSQAAREIAADRRSAPQLLVRFLSARLVAGVLIAAGWLCFFVLLSPRTNFKELLLWGAAYFVCIPWYADWLLRGLEDMRSVALAGCLSSVVMLMSSLVLIRLNEPVATLVLAWSASFFLAGVVILVANWRTLWSGLRRRTNVSSWRLHLRGSAIFALASLATLGIVQLPQLALGLFRAAPEQVAYLAGSLRLVALVITAAQVICWSLYPILASLQGDMDQLVRAERVLQRTTAALGIGVATIGFWFAPSLVGILLGKAYAPVVPVVRVLLLALPVWLGVQALEWIILARRLELRRLFGLGAAIIALSLGLIWAVPRGTAFAVALAIVVSLGVAGAALLASYVRVASWRIFDPRLVRNILAAALTAAALFALPQSLFTAAAAVVIYLLALYVTGAIGRQDITMINQLLTRKAN
jgi:O-antigen/teichoic acid export membrane protein